MAVTLVVNPGSSSKKYALYREGKVVFSMRFERTDFGVEQCTEISGIRQQCEGVSADTFSIALEHFLASAVLKEAITSPEVVTKVALRIVIPGSIFQKHCLIDSEYIRHLKNGQALAPLHVPHTLRELTVIQAVLPGAVLVAVSDSAFHSTLPPEARLYSIPRADAAADDIYRFGYHGLSVSSVVRRHHAVVGYEPKKAVVCHIGSGVSVTAVKDGKSVETTMGYAPGSGLIMASRAGDLDASALLSLMHARNWRPLDAQAYVNNHGGLNALGGTADLRLILEASARGEVAARDAVRMYIYQIARAIAASTIALEGFESLIFTATAGERSSLLRTEIAQQLGHLGVRVDADKNEEAHSRDGVISALDSQVKVAVIRTDEMGEMYTEAQRFG
ncbi:hypothetical protein K2Q16_03315 [Patescibacteria group bacterium]|nr:hypothetical protein [Patescibacteria group bacterium]